MAYDYLIVGTGLFGSVFAHEAAKRGTYSENVRKTDTYWRQLLHRKNKQESTYINMVRTFFIHRVKNLGLYQSVY